MHTAYFGNFNIVELYFSDSANLIFEIEYIIKGEKIKSDKKENS